MQNSFFYITAPSREVSEAIAESLVNKKLAACVNIVPEIKSYFYWEGKAQLEEEVLILGKTKTALINDLIKDVKENHPDQVPCIISWEINGGNEPFLQWIQDETR